MKCKGFERKRSWSNGYYLGIYQEGAEETQKNPQNNRCSTVFRTEHLPNASPGTYRYANLLRNSVYRVLTHGEHQSHCRIFCSKVLVTQFYTRERFEVIKAVIVLGYDTVCSCRRIPTFTRNISPPILGSKSEPREQPGEADEHLCGHVVSPATKERAIIEAFSVRFVPESRSAIPCGGGVEYLHRSPASRRRRRKGNPVPGDVTGPLCSCLI
jgi:hypothetical protein